MLKLSLNDICEHDPCKGIWETLLKSKGKTTADDVKFPITDVLESNDIEFSIWCLRCFDYREYCLFLADVVELVSPVLEDNQFPKKTIQAIRDYHAGKIEKHELNEAAYAASFATISATANIPNTPTVDATIAAAIAAYSDNTSVAIHATVATAVTGNWQEIEILFIKHFGE